MRYLAPFLSFAVTAWILWTPLSGIYRALLELVNLLP